MDNTVLLQPPSKIRHTLLSVNRYDIYIVGEIGYAENYIDELDLIRNADEDSVVFLRINTPGGNLFTAIQFMTAIKESQSTVVACIEGACMSAGTLIFLSASDFLISDHSVMMFHNYSGGTYGKGHELFSQAIFDKRWADKLHRDIFSEFLTPTEIESVIEGRDLYLDSDEINQRCEKLVIYRSELAEIENQIRLENGED